MGACAAVRAARRPLVALLVLLLVLGVLAGLGRWLWRAAGEAAAGQVGGQAAHEAIEAAVAEGGQGVAPTAEQAAECTAAAAAHGRLAKLGHHPLHLLELAEELADLGHRRAAAAGNATAPAVGNDVRVTALLGRHRKDDGLNVLILVVADLHLLLADELADAGDHLEELGERAHPLELLELVEEVFEVEGAGQDFLLQLLALFLGRLLLRLLDERDDVAHAEDAGGEAVGVEGLDGIHALARADELDRDADDGADRERSAAAGIAVHLGEDETGEREAAVELLGDADGLLAGHGVGDEEDFDRVDGGLDALDLLHHALVDLEAAGSVDDDRVVAVLARVGDGAPGDVDRVGVWALSVDGQVVLLAEGLQLRDGRWAVDVGGDEERAAAFLLEQGAELGDVGRFAGALQADEEEDARRLRRPLQRHALLTEQADEFLVDDRNDLLGGGEGAQDFLADGPLAHRGDEVADDAVVDVGLEEGTADFTQGFVDVFLGQAALAADALEGGGEAIGQRFKHQAASSSSKKRAST